MNWKLFMHEYWNRMWVVQEIALAKRVQILCRDAIYEWSEVREFLASAIADRREHESAKHHRFWSDIQFLETLAFSRHLEVTESAPLGELAPKFAFQDCKVPHDHVFSLISIASDGGDFVPDYAESRISLLLRVLTFCKYAPNRNHTAKLSFALRMDPYKEGIRMSLVGHVVEDLDSPLDQETTTKYQSVDTGHKPARAGDIVVSIPDTNLHLLFRPHKADKDQKPSYGIFVARVEPIPKSPEPVSCLPPKQIHPAWVKENWRRFREARLKWSETDRDLRLTCDDQLILGFFQFSETGAAPGSLSSGHRVWTRYSEAGHEHTQFTVTRGGTT